MLAGAQAPAGWRLGGGGITNGYETGIDRGQKHDGSAGGYLRSTVDQPRGPVWKPDAGDVSIANPPSNSELLTLQRAH
jgi:hypothetical protein